MNFIDKFDEWGIDLSQLTKKKQQINKKIAPPLRSGTSIIPGGKSKRNCVDRHLRNTSTD